MVAGTRRDRASWYHCRVRIVAGTLGGRHLTAPGGRTTRPTSDRVREAVFAILGPPPEDAAVLDLFAGSGAMALEALSRGAARATLVERDRGALRCIHDNVRALGVAAQVEIAAVDVRVFLRAAVRATPWSWVFIDPPYASTWAADALTALAGAALAEGAVVVVEHDRAHLPPAAIGSLLRTDERRYGDTWLSFFRRAPEPEPPPP